MLKTKAKALLTITGLFLFLVACQSFISNEISTTPTPDIKTEEPRQISLRDLLLNPNCSTPCWIGIQAGTTEFDEAMNILVSRKGIENISLDNNNNIFWEDYSLNGMSEGYILFSNNVATEIFFFPGEETELDIFALNEILGNPTWVQVFQDPNNPCLGVSLLYPAVGIYIALDFNGGLESITPSQRIIYIRFLDPQLARNLNAYDSILIEWSGYKNYCVEP